MKFDIPKVLRPLSLAEYGAEYAEAVIQVWVNPPRAKVQEYLDILRQVADPDEKIDLEQLGGEVSEWLSEIWSQGEPDTHWPPEEVSQLYQACVDRDPLLWQYISGQTWGMILEYRTSLKKASRLVSTS